jgi:peptidoglycan/LPS O-acetylase OafA/YrhL
MPEPVSQVGRHLGGLDGVRGVCALMVVAAHCFGHFAPETTPQGVAQILAQALTVFFVMSGMLIYTPFARDIARGERRLDVRQFAARRVLRIFPAYLVIFVIANFVLGAVYLTNAVEVGEPGSDVGTGRLTDPWGLLLNLTLLHTYSPTWVQTGINPSWSLTPELAFYALLPLLAVWLVGRSPRRLAVALLPAAVLGVAGVSARVWAEHLYAGSSGLTPYEAEFGANGIAVLSRSVLGIGDAFALGMVIAVLFVFIQRGELSWWTRRRAAVTGWTLLPLGAIVALALHDARPWLMGTFTSVAAAAVILLVVDPGARDESSVLVRIGDWRFLEYTGRVSLSLYLWHYSVLIMVTRAGIFEEDSLLSMLGSTVVVATIALALASVTFRWVEHPAMTGFGSRRSRRPAGDDGRG